MRRLPAATLLLTMVSGLASFIWASPIWASTPASWSAAQRAAIEACLKASDLDAPAVRGTPVILDDSASKTAVLVHGRWKPAHMKGARTTMLCLFDRASAVASVSEAIGWSAR